MTEQIPKQIKGYYDKAALAMDRNNYDYALDLLGHALALKPDLDESRYRMRLASRKKLELTPDSIVKKILIKIKEIIPVIKALIMEKKGNSIQASIIYENLLKYDPTNAFLLIRLATALENCEMEDIAIKTFEEALRQQPGNVAVLKSLAEIFILQEDYAKARPLYQTAARIAPADEETRQKLKDIDALASIQKGKWEDDENFRSKIKDNDEVLVLEKKDKVVRTESDIDILIEDNLKKIEQDPENHVLLRTIGDLYTRKNDFDTAQNYYNKVLELDPRNLGIKRRLGEIKIKKAELTLQEKVKQLDKETDNAALQKEVEELKINIEDLKLEQLADNVAQYPNDLSLRYQYGYTLFARDMLDKAIAEFQLAVKDPIKKTDALNMLGLSFKKKGMFDMAVAQFEKALEKLTALDDRKKDVLYNLGTVYEEMGKYKEALDEFKKIYEVDINFRDIAAKVDQAYKKQQEQEKEE